MIEPKEKDDYRRLLKPVSATSDGLQKIIEGDISKPSIDAEIEALNHIKAVLSDICLRSARMGIDLVEISEK